MKRCPRCQTEYPDDANWCRLDGGRLQKIDAPAQPKPAPQPGALTMGWDAQPEQSAATTTPMAAAKGPQLPQKPGNLTMGWDVQEEPAAAPAAAKAPRAPQKPGALTMGWDAVEPEPAPVAKPAKTPQQPGALTMGWEVPDEPKAQPLVRGSAASPAAGPRVPQQPGALTMGWEVPEEPAPATVTPSSIAAAPRLEPSAKATLLGMAPIRDQVGVPEFSAPKRVAQPIPAQPTVEVAQDLAPSQAGPHQAIQAPEPKAAPVPQVAPVPALRPSTDTGSLDKPPPNTLPIYAVVGLVVIAVICLAIILLTR